MGLTHDEFVGHLRSALHYLYDPVHLRHSPLVQYLNLADRFDPAADLQRALTAAIQALKPPESAAASSSGWRIYDLLNLQYLHQADREDVAAQLGISERQLRREQRLALEALARSLWRPLSQDAPADHSAVPMPALDENLGWLKTSGSDPLIPLEEALTDAVNLTQQLASRWSVTLKISVEPDLAGLPFPQQVLRNVLLALLSIAIPQSSEGQVLLQALRQDDRIAIRVSGDPELGPFVENEKDLAALATVQRLADYMNARWFGPNPAAPFAVTLSLSMPEQIPILVLDDNSDWLELLKRYTAGSQFRLIGVRDAQNARALAEKLQPAVIILDVMMPNIDVWTILHELRREPATSQIPIVVSTILPLEDLSLSLGATSFLQKPVTQEQFLSELHRHIHPSPQPGFGPEEAAR